LMLKETSRIHVERRNIEQSPYHKYKIGTTHGLRCLSLSDTVVTFFLIPEFYLANKKKEQPTTAALN
jgi:hypothetical protein